MTSCHNKYFRVWTVLSVNKSILLFIITIISLSRFIKVFLSRDKLEVWQHTLKLRLPTAFYHTELTEIRDQTIDTEWNNREQQLDKVLCSLIRIFACFPRDI